MAKRLHPLLLLFLALLPKSVFSQSEGFSLKLVRRDFLEKDQFPDTIRPPITRSHYLFTIDATIGTPPSKRTFIFDPGSSLTWTQCTPCAHCFKQDYPLFDPKKSSSYQKLSPKHALARFFNRSSNGEYIFNVTLVTGIMGMNRSPLSLIGQMGSKSSRRFSYCLPGVNSPIKSTFLRFGNDIKERKTFKKTGFLDARNDYSIRLLTVSIAGRVLRLPKGSFSNGCILDVGSANSRMEMGAYNAVLSVLREYFDPFNLTRLSGDPDSQDKLCYHLKPGFRNYPGMNFHFQGADLEIGPENLFRFKNDRFCLAMSGTQHLTILGAHQQQNVRFIYDIGKERLLFTKEDCSQDKAS